MQVGMRRIPAAYPCPQVQVVEFDEYDMDTALRYVMFARLSYVEDGNGLKFFEF
jgi:hypothetical protein